MKGPLGSKILIHTCLMNIVQSYAVQSFLGGNHGDTFKSKKTGFNISFANFVASLFSEKKFYSKTTNCRILNFILTFVM